jgi:Ser/Thr protein kinase RdoA (MazF antagonist)
VQERPVALPGVANVVLGFPAAGIVAKVATRPKTMESLPKEHAIACELAALGAATSRPVPNLSPTVHEGTGFMVTVWHHVDHDPAMDMPPEAVTAALAELHTALDRTTTPVPPFIDELVDARRALDDDEFMSALAPADCDFLRATFDRALEELAALPFEGHRLHGEPHQANHLATPTGVVWVDFESCCSGPREWDLAFMAPETVASPVVDVDDELLACLRRLNHARFATWRWGLVRRYPELRDHAIADLAFLKR